MENKYKISVVIPVYNSSAFINKCMNSLYKQDFKKPFEIIIIDDASTDNTLEMIKKWNLLNISFFSLTLNSGPSTARNIGIKHAKGEYIYFLDADDAIPVVLPTVDIDSPVDFKDIISLAYSNWSPYISGIIRK